MMATAEATAALGPETLEVTCLDSERIAKWYRQHHHPGGRSGTPVREQARKAFCGKCNALLLVTENQP